MATLLDLGKKLQQLFSGVVNQPTTYAQPQQTSLSRPQFAPPPTQQFKPYQPVQNMNLYKDMANRATTIFSTPFGNTDPNRGAIGALFRGEFNQIPQKLQETNKILADKLRTTEGMIQMVENFGPQAMGTYAGRAATGFANAAKQGNVFKGKFDLKPRFEIPDAEASVIKPLLDKIQPSKAIKGIGDIINAVKSLKGDKVTKVRLGSVLDHPELYQNYPELKGMTIAFTKDAKNIRNQGGYNPRDNSIIINLASHKDSTQIKSTILHEIQHAIQQKENFARGGNMATAGYNKYKNMAGELESRDVEARMNLGREDLGRIEPYSSAQVNPREVGVSFVNPSGMASRIKGPPVPQVSNIQTPSAGSSVRISVPSKSSISVNSQNANIPGGDIPGVPSGRILSQSADSTTMPPKVPTPESPVQQLPGGGQSGGVGSPSSPASVSDPVQKIIAALKGAKSIRGQQEKLYSQERSRRAGAIAGIGSRVPGEKGFFAQLGQLKGELPKVSFESIRKQLQQPDIDNLFNQVEQKSYFSPFEKITAKGGLAKLLGAEGGSVPTEGELKLLNEVFPPEFIQTVMAKRTTMEKLWTTGEELLNLPRSLMATLDLSAPLRQGIFLIGRPKQWGPAFGNMFKYAFSEKAYEGLKANIQSRPTYPLMRQSNLAITDTSPILQGREEAFMSNMAERFKLIGPVVKASNRAYSGFLNKLRADTFDDLYRNAENLGLAKDNPKLVDDIAKFVNSATGRGSLGALDRSVPILNGVFFSPRLMASRINMLNPAYYASLDPFVRKEALKSLFTFGATAGTVLTLAKLNGAEVGADPRSADFGKIRINNTRYDILGGFQQYIRLASQLITGQKINSMTGHPQTLGEGYGKPTRKDLLISFFESKEAPVMSFVTQMLQGKDGAGNPLSLPVEVINRVTPMMVQDIYDLAKEWGPKGVLMGIPGIFGVGSMTYGKQIPNMETTPSGKPTIKYNSVPGLSEDIVNTFTNKPLSNIPEDQWQGLNDLKKAQDEAQYQKEQMKKDLINQLPKEDPGAIKAAESNPEFPTGSLVTAQELTNKATQSTSPNQKLMDKTVLDLAKQKVQMGLPLSPSELQVLEKEQEPQVTKAAYELAVDQAKRTDNLEAYLKQTTDYVGYLNQYKKGLDPTTDKAEIIRTQNKIEDLIATKSQYESYGGFTKPKKGKKGKKFSFKAKAVQFKPLSFKSSKPTLKTIKFKKPPSLRIKSPRMGKLKLSQPKLQRFRNTLVR